MSSRLAGKGACACSSDQVTNIRLRPSLREEHRGGAAGDRLARFGRPSMKRMYVAFLASLIALLFPLQAHSAPTGLVRKRGPAVSAGLTPSQYAAKMAGIDTCEQFRSVASTLPNAVNLVWNIVAGDNEDAIKKGEYETSAQYGARMQNFWLSKLGDPTRLVFKIPIEPGDIKYDADSQTSTVRYIVDGIGFAQWINVLRKQNSRREYVGSNAFGVTANVTAWSGTELKLRLKNRQLNGVRGSYFNPEWDIRLNPDNAREFSDNGSMLILASLAEPFIESKNNYSEATLDSPYSDSTRVHELNVDVKCAFFASRGVPIAPIEVIDRDEIWSH